MPADRDRFEQIDRLFAAALSRPPDSWPDFLAEACGGDAPLRDEVERLLAADRRNVSFLETPPGGLAPELAARDGPGLVGRALGPYRLEAKIGEGGMGAVYLASRDDGQLERRVAVKLLLAGLEDTEHFHRFLAERQILARLEHPNIARLYDVGSTEDGRPYLVMEHVDGQPIDAWCDARRLTVEQRITLFRKVCSAVELAHQNLLVHRDLKPANILVDGAGEPKLLDFGIAKQLSAEPDAAVTQTVLRAMTPSYASPEQVKGEPISTASDVYALGVVLYELLTGKSPYRAGSAPHEIEQAICEQLPVRPSLAVRGAGGDETARSRRSRPAALARRLRGDLDNILLMALRKEPRRRYRSVTELVGDLDRHLASLPVVARGDSLAYRTGRFLRRHRAAAAVTVVAAVLGVGFLLREVAQNQRLERERDKASYTLSFLLDTFGESDPYQTGGERVSARDILDAGARRVERELGGNPEVEAAVLDTLGSTYLRLGSVKSAAPLLEKALAQRRRLFGSAHPEVAASLRSLGSLRLKQGDLAAAEAAYRAALGILERRVGREHADYAAALGELGEVLTEAGRWDEADRVLGEAHRALLAVSGPAAPQIAEALLKRAELNKQQGHFTEAEQLIREALGVHRAHYGESHPRVSETRARLAQVLLEQGRAQEGEKLLREILATQRRTLGAGHFETVKTLSDLALSRQMQGDYAGAEVLYRQVYEHLRRELGERNPQVGDAASNLGAILSALRRNEEARDFHQRALEIRQAVYGERHVKVIESLFLLAKVVADLGNPEAAIAMNRRAVALGEVVLGEESPYLAYPVTDLGFFLIPRNPAEAEGHLRRGLAIRRKTLPADHFEIAWSKLVLGHCLVRLGKLDEGLALLREGHAATVAKFPAASPRVQHAVKYLAEAQRRAAEAEQAIE